MDLSDAAVDLARGAVAGLAVCIPPGPVSTLCVSRSVRQGFASGFATAAGAAVGDALYAGIAAFGLASVRGSLGSASRVIAAVAAPVLLWMGVRLLARSRAAMQAARGGVTSGDAGASSPRPARAAGAAFVMALGTPGTLPAFVALFAALGSSDATSGGLRAPLVSTAGVLGGALAWWAAVAYLSHRHRARAARHLHVIEAAGGVLLVAAALVAVHFAIFGSVTPGG